MQNHSFTKTILAAFRYAMSGYMYLKLRYASNKNT
jgi:hypothetical protein